MPPTAVFVHPSQAELTQFFGVDPIESVPEDGYWAYEVRDVEGLSTRFSFNAHERSVQVALSTLGRERFVVSQEGALHMRIGDHDGNRTLVCEFSWRGANAILRLSIEPTIATSWATLRTE